MNTEISYEKSFPLDNIFVKRVTVGTLGILLALADSIKKIKKKTDAFRWYECHVGRRHENSLNPYEIKELHLAPRPEPRGGTIDVCFIWGMR